MLLKRKLVISTAIALGMVASASFAGDHGSHASWGYEGSHGPAHWGDLDANYATCKTGKSQSPINIIDADAVPADLDKIKFNYQTSPLKIIDNGHTVKANYSQGSSITVDGKTYNLLQVHFHQPSEENVNGKPYAMDAHLVHQGADGQLAVVAVLMKEGKENSFLETLWKNIPETQGEEKAVKDAYIHLANLLPKKQTYYSFSGSLTTPPCSENVKWMVMNTPVEISKEQIGTFGKHYSHNARPVQPLNGRDVKVSK